MFPDDINEIFSSDMIKKKTSMGVNYESDEE